MATTLCCCPWTDIGRLFRASRTAYSTSRRGKSSDGVGTTDGLGEAEGDPPTLDPCPQLARIRVSQTNPLFTRGYFTATCTQPTTFSFRWRGRHFLLPPLAGRGRGGGVSHARAELALGSRSLFQALTYTVDATGCFRRPACYWLHTRWRA